MKIQFLLTKKDKKLQPMKLLLKLLLYIKMDKSLMNLLINKMEKLSMNLKNYMLLALMMLIKLLCLNMLKLWYF